MGFKFPSGHFLRKEQYLMYGYDMFIADIGGFLGLLLGHSIWSMYNIFMARVETVKWK